MTCESGRRRKPRPVDAAAIFDAYASDAEVTKYLAWKQHAYVDDTEAFIEFSDQEWAAWNTGPLVIESRETGRIIGGTGLSFETSFKAATGYVLAEHAWGRGYATEALQAVLALARSTDLWRVEAICHHEHVRSARVLEKCGFELEGTLRRHSIFPNHIPEIPQDVLLFALVLR